MSQDAAIVLDRLRATGDDDEPILVSVSLHVAESAAQLELP